jgi:membrane protein implicated in regulation of membrane protease activity
MIRVNIHRRGGVDASTSSKALGFVLVAVGLACVVLLLLGLWLLLAIAFTTMAVVALVRAVLTRSHARERMTEGHSIIEGEARCCAMDDAGGKESSSSPFLDSKP